MSISSTARIAIYDCNPGGNYTYIVYGTGLKRENYGNLDRAIRAAYPHFEQGGFIESPINKSSVLRLHMAGGEFCGNASRCLAALIAHDYSANRELAHIADYSLIKESSRRLRFAIEVSGVSEMLQVNCSVQEERYMVKAEMPFIRSFSSITQRQIILQSLLVKIVIVQMEGITHILIDEANFPFVQSYDEQRQIADVAINQCQLQEEPAVGLIWYSLANPTIAINPVVWVRNINTCIYESACGSGTLALALEQLRNSPREHERYDIQQPSGAKIKVIVSKSRDKAQFTSAAIEGLVSLKSLPIHKIK